MSTQGLKQKIQRDLHTLKSLDLDIMSAKSYYWGNLKAFVMLWSFFLLAQLIAVKVINASGVWQEYFDFYASHTNAIYFKMYAGCGLASFIINLFFIGKIKLYIIFKHQISQHLETGNIILRKMRLAIYLILGLYAAFIFPLTLFCDPDVSLFAGLGAFVFSALLAQFIIQMELTRIGMSVIYKSVATLFNKMSPDVEA